MTSLPSAEKWAVKIGKRSRKILCILGLCSPSIWKMFHNNSIRFTSVWRSYFSKSEEKTTNLKLKQIHLLNKMLSMAMFMMLKWNENLKNDCLTMISYWFSHWEEARKQAMNDLRSQNWTRAYPPCKHSKEVIGYVTWNKLILWSMPAANKTWAVGWNSTEFNLP